MVNIVILFNLLTFELIIPDIISPEKSKNKNSRLYSSSRNDQLILLLHIKNSSSLTMDKNDELLKLLGKLLIQVKQVQKNHKN